MSAAEPGLFDLVIAYLVVLVALSSLVSAVLQVLDRVLRLRHRWLRRCLGRLFTRAGLTQVSPSGMGHLTEFWRRWGLTSTVPGGANGPAGPRSAGQQIQAFFGDPAINPSGERGLEAVDGASTAAWIAQTRAAAGQTDPGSLPSPDADPKAHALWWTAFEAGATDGFTRVMVVLGFMVGLGLSWGLGIDAIGLGQTLARSPARVSALIAGADGGGGSAYNSPADPFPAAFEKQLRAQLEPCSPDGLTPRCDDTVAALMELAEGAAPEASVRLPGLLDARAAINASPPGAPALARALREVLREQALSDEGTAGDADAAPMEARVLAALGGADPNPDACLQVRAALSTLDLHWTEAPSPNDALAALQGLPLRRFELLDQAVLTQGATLARHAAQDSRLSQAPALGFAGVQRSAGLLARLLGSALFALFVAGGAPIWFDLLNRLLAIRRGDAPAAGGSAS